MAEDRVLDPIDRNSEIMFGLFMVLTFTGTLSVATAGRQDVKTMLATAIGCNTAWGFVDGVMYVLRNIVARGRQAKLRRNLRAAERPQDARRLIAEEIGEMAAGLDAPALERLHQWLVDQPAAAEPRPAVTARDLRGAFGIFGLVFASTFPVVLPFVFVANLHLAMRISGAIAIAIMFYCGHTWGRYAGIAPWRAGLVLVLLGAAIEAVIIALGG